MGGTQLGAVDTAVGLIDLGHEMIFATADGPLGGALRRNGVRFVDLPPAARRRARLSALAGIAREVRPDVIHAYEVRSILDCCLMASMGPPIPVLGTILSTRVPWFLPESLPLTVGMPNLAEFTRRWRSGPTTLVPPPVPMSIAGERSSLVKAGGPLEGRRLIILISRLVEPFKREGIMRAIEAMDELGGRGFGLLVVGDGPARPLYEGAASSIRQRLGPEVIAFVGAVLDPGHLIEAADVIVGNGTSIIRGGMMGKPAVVVGREGFSAVVAPETLPGLIDRGFYGVGDGSSTGDFLAEQVMASLAPERGNELTVVSDELRALYGREAVASRLERELKDASRGAPPGRGEMARSLARMAHYRLLRVGLRSEARRVGLDSENADNFVYGRLRDMALPPPRRGTGRNLGLELDTQEASDTPAH